MSPQPKWLRAPGNTRDGAFISDATQRILFWNKGAERLLGYTQSEVYGRQCHKVIAGRIFSIPAGVEISFKERARRLSVCGTLRS